MVGLSHMRPSRPISTLRALLSLRAVSVDSLCAEFPIKGGYNFFRVTCHVTFQTGADRAFRGVRRVALVPVQSSIATPVSRSNLISLTMRHPGRVSLSRRGGASRLVVRVVGSKA